MVFVELEKDNIRAEKAGEALIHWKTTIASGWVLHDTEFQEFHHEEEIRKTVFSYEHFKMEAIDWYASLFPSFLLYGM